MSTLTCEPVAGPSEADWKSRLGRHIPALDGLRGIAILMVLCFHFTKQIDRTWFSFHSAVGALIGVSAAGWIGVDLFFVLSGFLITGILVDTRSSENYFRTFYARRTLRIFPLYFAVLSVVLFVWLIRFHLHPIPGEPALFLKSQLYLWTYTTNIGVSRMGWTGFEGHGPMLRHFWSLAVEEQFYLVWPFVLYFISRRTAIRVCVACAMIAFFLRMCLHERWGLTIACYALTPCRMDDLLAGAFLALWLRQTDLPYRQIARRAIAIAIGATFLLLAMIAWRRKLSDHDPVVLIYGFPLLALLSVSVLGIALQRPVDSMTARALGSSFLRFFGRYSYGLYVFHYPLTAYVYDHAGPEWWMPHVHSRTIACVAYLTTATLLTIVAALVSWYALEQPILSLKRYFSYSKTK